MNNKNEIKKYVNTNELIKVCKSFENTKIELNVKFNDKNIKIFNCNIIGNIFEDILYTQIKEEIQDFEKGPKQKSPDFYGGDKEYFFEQKVFMKNANFDIGNFTSYIHQLCEDNGVYKKIYKTKYLIFEYFLNDEKDIIIKKFHFLNVYNLVSYKRKYPISMQVKKNVWYNIRPDCANNWYSDDKTPHKFIENIIDCIKLCPHIEDKNDKINNIKNQFDDLNLKYTL